MALAFDAASSNSEATSATVSWAHTCTGSDLILIVGTYYSGLAVTGVTYDGDSLSQIGGAVVVPGSSRNIEIWYKVGPSTGSNTVLVTCAGSTEVSGTAASYTGAKQVSIPDASDTNTESATTSFVTSLTTVLDNSWTILYGAALNDAPVAGSGVTSRGSEFRLTILGDSNAPVTPVGSNSMTLTRGASDNFAAHIISLAPFVTETATIGESISLTESIDTSKILNFSASDPLILTEAVAGIRARVKTVSDSIALADSISLSGPTWTRRTKPSTGWSSARDSVVAGNATPVFPMIIGTSTVGTITTTWTDRTEPTTTWTGR